MIKVRGQLFVFGKRQLRFTWWLIEHKLIKGVGARYMLHPITNKRALEVQEYEAYKIVSIVIGFINERIIDEEGKRNKADLIGYNMIEEIDD